MRRRGRDGRDGGRRARGARERRRADGRATRGRGDGRRRLLHGGTCGRRGQGDRGRAVMVVVLIRVRRMRRRVSLGECVRRRCQRPEMRGARDVEAHCDLLYRRPRGRRIRLSELLLLRWHGRGRLGDGGLHAGFLASGLDTRYNER